MLLLAVRDRYRARRRPSSSAAALPSCRVADVTTAHRVVHRLDAHDPRHDLSADQRLWPVRPPLDRRRRAERRPARPGAGHHRPAGDGPGGTRGRRAARRPVGVPKLFDPDLDLRLLGPRVRLRRGPAIEREGGPQRASARDDPRLQELRRVRAVELLGLGSDQGRSVVAQQRLEVRLRDVLPEGQDTRSPATPTSHGISGMSGAPWRRRSTPAA